MPMNDIEDLYMALKLTIAEVGKDRSLTPSDILGGVCLTLGSLIEFMSKQSRMHRTKEELWTATQAMVEIVLNSPAGADIKPLDLN